MPVTEIITKIITEIHNDKLKSNNTVSQAFIEIGFKLKPDNIGLYCYDYENTSTVNTELAKNLIDFLRTKKIEFESSKKLDNIKKNIIKKIIYDHYIKSLYIFILFNMSKSASQDMTKDLKEINEKIVNMLGEGISDSSVENLKKNVNALEEKLETFNQIMSETFTYIDSFIIPKELKTES